MASNDVGTRAEHLAWCRERAMYYVRMGDMSQALASFFSDINKHSETRSNTMAIELGQRLMVGGHLSTAEEVTRYIDGFN